MSKLITLELFGGVGACSMALRNLGIDNKIVDYVEIDKYAVKSFNAIHGTNFEPQDICKWDKDYEKASKVNSNTQLYKQAGNSIVVNVLEAILKELLLNE